MGNTLRDLSRVASTIALAWGVATCAPPPTPAADSAREPHPPVVSTPTPVPSTAVTAPPVASAPPAPKPPPPSIRCAHSVGSTAAVDATDEAALADCRFVKTGHDDIGDKCADIPHEVSLDRLEEAVMPMSPSVQQHVRKVWAKGRELGRRPRVFGLIGDSITASPKFMFPVGRAGSTMSPEVMERLRMDHTTVVDLYRGAPAVGTADSFSATRAAKVGAPSSWAIPEGLTPTANPVGRLIRSHSPAIVVLMFGSNDAATRFLDHAELVRGFEQRMSRIIDQLEEAGIVVVLNTVPRHMFNPGQRMCDKSPGDLSNWRMAVQTNAVSAVAANLACERHLPLIDLRHAFDALLNHGIGPDGVHPNAHPGGAGKLDADGLRCGYNVRNYVTLRMLREVHRVVDDFQQ